MLLCRSTDLVAVLEAVAPSNSGTRAHSTAGPAGGCSLRSHAAMARQSVAITVAVVAVIMEEAEVGITAEVVAIMEDLDVSRNQMDGWI